MRLEVAKDERGLFVESDNTVLQISKSIYKRRPACEGCEKIAVEFVEKLKKEGAA